ncbi:hypothetical protein C8J57DRAFT_1260428 [Mycena rebaudengoi]|nr:hypothetical protein C8J57DRAFT_1260428 [Mycena rebaudengoi]
MPNGSGGGASSSTTTGSTPSSTYVGCCSDNIKDGTGESEDSFFTGNSPRTVCKPFWEHSARPRTITFYPTKYRFKLALLKNNYEEMLRHPHLDVDCIAKVEPNNLRRNLEFAAAAEAVSVFTKATTSDAARFTKHLLGLKPDPKIVVQNCRASPATHCGGRPQPQERHRDLVRRIYGIRDLRCELHANIQGIVGGIVPLH